MNLFVRLIGLFIFFGLTLPVLSLAQEKKGDKAAKKDEAKKDDKKDLKDDDPKRKDPKKAEPEEKLVYGQVFSAKIKRMDANSNRDFTVELPMVDPQKVYNLHSNGKCSKWSQ